MRSAYAFKLFRQRKDGSLGPLFINRRQRIPLNEWLNAEAHPTKGYKFRPGWHCTRLQLAPHLSKKNRVWCKVEIEDFTTFKRPKTQGGDWFIAERIRVVEILEGIPVSEWLDEDHASMRVIAGSDPSIIANRVAFIEKTPRVRVGPWEEFECGKNWFEGPKGCAPEYGKYQPSRDWCDEQLLQLGYVIND